MLITVNNKLIVQLNPFHTRGLYLYLLKTSENLWFSYVFRGVEREQCHEMSLDNNFPKNVISHYTALELVRS